MYNNPKSMFQDKLRKIIKREEKEMGVFDHIFKLQNMLVLERMDFNPSEPIERANWEALLEIYNELGATKFAKIVSILRGRTVVFPTESEYQASILTAVCYYYKELGGLSWRDIKSKLEMPELSTVKYGIKVRDLKKFINSGYVKLAEDIEKEGKSNE